MVVVIEEPAYCRRVARHLSIGRGRVQVARKCRRLFGALVEGSGWLKGATVAEPGLPKRWGLAHVRCWRLDGIQGFGGCWAGGMTRMFCRVSLPLG